MFHLVTVLILHEQIIVAQIICHSILFLVCIAKILQSDSRCFVSFDRFSEVHEFDKPNDEQALNLMNSCAVAVLEEFEDITFAYGVSDEYRYHFFIYFVIFWLSLKFSQKV